MYIKPLPLSAALAAAALLTVAACGGGGGGGGDAAKSTTLEGIAATGAAFGDAQATATDANGTAIDCGTTDTDTGKYRCVVPASAVAPLVIEVLRSATGEAYYSVVASKETSTANVTPLTTAIVAGLSPSGDPAEFKNEVKADATRASAAKLQTQVTLLKTNLQAVIDATTGTGSAFDPISGALVAGSGNGMDKILDAVKITTTPTTADGGKAKIEIALRADPDAVVTLEKGNESAATPITSTAVKDVQTAIDAKPADLVKDLFTRMNACYALPVAQRVDSTATLATSVNVIADACRTLFKGDNPANFKSGGNTVSANGAFKSLFKEIANNLKFDQGNLEYIVKNPGAPNDGFWVVSYRATDASGNVSYDNFSLYKDGTGSDAKLKHAGNQYDYDTGVKAFVQDREFPNAAGNNYLSTGYTLNVTNKAASSGSGSAFAKVVVVSPKNTEFTLKPLSGISYLGLAKSTTVTSSNFVRIGYGHTDATNTATDYPAGDGDRLFFSPTKWSDADIAAIPDQGTWTFKIYLSGVDYNNTANQPIIQKHRTLGRAPTMAELRKRVFPAITSSLRDDIASVSTPGWYLFSETRVQAEIGNATAPAWTVPARAIAPTTVTVYGNAPLSDNNWGSTFNDSVTVLPSTRYATVPCSRQGASDTHCVASVANGASGNYAVGARATDLQLNASTNRLGISKHVAFYQP